MFDTRLRRLIDPPLERVAGQAVRWNLKADQITLAGFGLGCIACLCIAWQLYWAGLIFIALNRLCDGLDGAVARIREEKTDRGGYLDIVLDFFFYGGVPLAFAIAVPPANALPAAALLFSFYANGSAFLAFAVMAEKRGLETDAQGQKSLYYLSGLAEGGETIAVFCLMCLFPAAFAWIAWVFAGVCCLSAGARVVASQKVLGG